MMLKSSCVCHQHGLPILLSLAYSKIPTEVHNAPQKEETKAKAKKAAEAEDAQKKLADIMVEAQKKVRCQAPWFVAHLRCGF